MRSGGSLNPNPRNNGSDKGPLRKIVGMKDDLELLECGHTQWGRGDIFGHTAPERRRCRKCKQGKPPDVQP
jgi:hypothetical protein